MQDNDATAEDADELRNWTEQNFQAIKQKIENVEQEMRNNKPQENISVRKVSTEKGDRIIVEHSVQRWFSPEYFRKMLQNDNNNNSSDGSLF